MNKKLYTDIIKAANIIHKKGRKGESNFIIASPEFSKILIKYKNKQKRLEKLKKINGINKP